MRWGASRTTPAPHPSRPATASGTPRTAPTRDSTPLELLALPSRTGLCIEALGNARSIFVAPAAVEAAKAGGFDSQGADVAGVGESDRGHDHGRDWVCRSLFGSEAAP